MKLSNYQLLLAAAIASSVAMGAIASDSKTTASPALNVLSSTTSAELPAKAADLVAKADAKNLKNTTVDVVKAAVGLNPAAAPAIVGSISQTTPTMAPTASATAAALVPDQVLLIARAAAAASPSQAGAIVEAICRVLPASYEKIAVAVAEVVPGAGKEILAGVTTAIPGLKGTVDKTLANYQGSVPSVSTVLSQVSQTETSANVVALASAAPATTAKPAATTLIPAAQVVTPTTPVVPVSTTPTITSGNGGTPIVPGRGGRTYSAP